MSLEVGTPVSVLWQKPRPRWWPGVVCTIHKSIYYVKYNDGEQSRHPVKSWGSDRGVRVRASKRRTRADDDIKHTYNSELKADSPNKRRCRSMLSDAVVDQGRSGRALLLDDQHLLGTKMLHATGTKWTVTTPNNDRAVVAKMTKAGLSRPVHAYIGEVIADRASDAVYDFVWLDYCGQAGSASRAATPMWDIAQLFTLQRLAVGATLAVTVCARARQKAKKSDPKYLNLVRVTQQVYHCAALAGRLVAQSERPLIYTDKGSMTMCFAMFTVC